MTREKFLSEHPTLYHMADARNWDSIREHGLLSTSALLDLGEISGVERDHLESGHRAETRAIQAQEREVFVRDQHPLSMLALASCLDGVQPHEWLQLLNGRVFFWPTRKRLETMLKAYRSEPQAVFEIDTRRFLESHGAEIELSHINSGFASTFYKPARRGRQTFIPLADYQHSSANKIAEVTVPHSVPDIFDLTQSVTEYHEGEPQRVLWAEH